MSSKNLQRKKPLVAKPGLFFLFFRIITFDGGTIKRFYCCINCKDVLNYISLKGAKTGDTEMSIFKKLSHTKIKNP